jgi:oxygen-dependent protoporphyrinogen oxidase
MHQRVLVIGGGITGLAAAHHLISNHPEYAVTLVERDTRIGGKILTVEQDGYVIEGGPDSMLGVKPRGVGLSHEIGLGDRLVSPIEDNRRSFVLRKGTLHRIPEGLTGLVPTRLGPIAKSGLISPRGKLRMLADYARKPAAGDHDESLASFMTRRLGGEVYTNLIEPLMAGIYAGDGRALSLQATFPQLREAERQHGGLIKGVLAQRRGTEEQNDGNGAKRPGFVTYQTGLRELVGTLSDRIVAGGGEIRTGVTVSLLKRCDHGYRVTIDRDDGPETMRVDAIIVATQAWAAAPLLEPLDHHASAALDHIPHVSNAIVALGFDDPSVADRLNGFGYVVPRTGQRPVMAMTWLSSKWPGRAPEGKALIRAFVGRAGQQDILQCPDDTLVDVVRRELSEVLGITATPETSRIFHWDGGMPQYTMGHRDRIATLESALESIPGVSVAGNMLRGVGLPDCIRRGKDRLRSGWNRYTYCGKRCVTPHVDCREISILALSSHTRCKATNLASLPVLTCSDSVTIRHILSEPIQPV